MVQPFVEFEKKFIPRLRSLKKIYVVAQSYQRGADLFCETQTPLLVSAYDDRGLAEIHLKAIRDDQYACIINLCNQRHFDKFLAMLDTGSPYKIYWSVVKDAARLEKLLTATYADNIRRYIEKHTNWGIGGREKILPSFEVTFGELFVRLKWKSQQQRIKFEEIEKS